MSLWLTDTSAKARATLLSDNHSMPAEMHNKRLRGNPKLKRQWEHVRESAEARGADPGSAIAQASGVVKRASMKKRSKR